MSDTKRIVSRILEGASVRKVIESESSGDYIEHYSGKLGDFDYDTREFEYIEDDTQDPWLQYVGSEADGSKIKIPIGIKDCTGMFSGCDFLRVAPEIPNGVKICRNMFGGCESLIKAPIIPNSVEDCTWMFVNCKSLKIAPGIPDSVIACDWMFDHCRLLTKAPIIPNSVENCFDMFKGCPEDVQKAGEWNIEHRGESYYDQN